MLQSSKMYKQTMASKLRPRAYISIALGIINLDAQKDCTVTSNLAVWSNGNIFDATGQAQEFVNYTTLEEKYNVSNGSNIFMPEADQYKYNGICVPNIGDSIRVDFGYIYDIKGLTVDFGEDYPTEFTITTSRGDTFNYTNDVEKFECETTFGEIEYLIITPISFMSGDNVRLRIRSMLMGIGLMFDNTVVETANITSFISSISENVSFANYTAVIFDTAKKFDVDNDDSFMNYIEPLQTIEFYFGQDLNNGEREWRKIGTGYVETWSSKGGKLTINATDKLSQLKNNYELGYRIYNRTAYDECISILEDAGYEADEYSVDTFLQNIPLVNPMPICPHREALQLVCNASRCIAYENADGIIIVKANFEQVLDPEEIVVSSSTQTPWSIVNNVLHGALTEYMDLSSNMGRTDETQLFLPEDSSQFADDTGFVSQDIANSDGTFTNNPYVMLTLPARFSYYSTIIRFGGVIPKVLKVSLYQDNTKLAEYTYDEILAETTVILEDYILFNKIKFEVTETEPNARVLINEIRFGDVTGYFMSNELMTDNPCGFKEEKVKDVKVKIYDYEIDEQGNPKEIENNNFYDLQINIKGEDRTCTNPLIHTESHAETVAVWLGNYYKNNVSYSVRFRGDPTLQTSDIIKLENQYKDNLQVEIETNKLTFNGAYSGELELRRALKLMSMEE